MNLFTSLGESKHNCQLPYTFIKQALKVDIENYSTTIYTAIA